MILSSADILRVLGGSEIIRLSAKLKIVDGKPSLSGAEGIYICVDRFPELSEFQATWTIYIESDEEDDLVVAEIQRLLPSVQVKPGLMTTVTTTDFLSENTQRPPAAEKTKKVEVDLAKYEERFQSLVEDVQDRMLLVSSGRPGRDGKDGRDGYDGRDGKDVDATQVELFDLKDVEQSILPMEKGQVLTWDGSKWTNLYVRQTMSAGGPVGGTTASGGTGVSSTIAWTYHPHDHTEEPNSGHFHTDSSDGDLVTKFHVSDETSRGNNVEVLLRDLLQQGYDRIYVALGEDLSQAHLYAITGYLETLSGFELTVVHIESAGTEPDYQNAKGYEFLFTKSAVAGGGGIPEAPIDGNYYVRQNGSWVNLETALGALGVAIAKILDGGNFTTGGSSAQSSTTIDGGNLTTGTSGAADGTTYDGGIVTGIDISNETIDGGNFS